LLSKLALSHANPRGRAVLVHEWTPSESLRKHMLAVEAAMRAYAVRFGEDVISGASPASSMILTTSDFLTIRRLPTSNTPSEVRHLRALGWPTEICEAVLRTLTGVPRTTLIAKTSLRVTN
jgi:predicted hydrolase (HD superfamily)